MYTLYILILLHQTIYMYIRTSILNIEMRSNNIQNAKPKNANQPTFPERLKKSKQGQTRCQLWVGCGAKPVPNGSFCEGFNNNDNDNKDNKNNNDRFFVLKYQFFWYLYNPKHGRIFQTGWFNQQLPLHPLEPMEKCRFLHPQNMGSNGFLMVSVSASSHRTTTRKDVPGRKWMDQR